MKNNSYIAWFDEIGKEDGGKVGGKGANLGEMFRVKIPVPFGFVVKAQAYFEFIKSTGLDRKIKEQLNVLNHHDPNQLNQVAKIIQKMILKEAIPTEVARQIMVSYLDLPLYAKKKQQIIQKLASFLKNPLVAIRSSATAEDLPSVSEDEYVFVKLNGRPFFGKIKELFDFEYRWEVYKPAEQRQYGYYVLPILYGSRFIARFEPVLDKENNSLIIKNWWWESGIKVTAKMRNELQLSMKRFMDFTGAQSIYQDLSIF